MSWTDERIAKLEELWNEGLTASAIAKELGDVTRNAVIGKVHRLGLKSRTKPVRKTAQEQVIEEETIVAEPVEQQAAENEAQEKETIVQAQAQAKVHASAGNAALKVEVDTEIEPQKFNDSSSGSGNIVPVHHRATILQLNERRCKWPIGDPMSEDFYYCGKPKEAAKSYCEDHCKIAYQTNERN